jgi:hypothetical protein
MSEVEFVNLVIATVFNTEGESGSASRKCEDDWSDYDEMAEEAIQTAQEDYENGSPYAMPTRVVLHKIRSPKPKHVRSSVIIATLPEQTANETVTEATIAA